MIQAFPKIFAIGTDYIRDIFNGPVEISEKVDGSQFGFGKVGGELLIRSKGAREKMFSEGIAYVESVAHLLPEGIIFYGEYLKKPKHNTLAYQRIPNNHIMLFGAMNIAAQSFDPSFQSWADVLGLEVVPKWEATIANADDLRHQLDRESVLGGCKVEGVVVKNYSRPFLLGGQPIPIMAGKFVSESFKEVHRNRWGTEEKGSSKWATFCGSFNTVARWEKSVQHLAENGSISNTPKDIGALLKEVHADIEAEEKEAIKEYLWHENKREIFGAAVRGLPEWYKQRLLESAFTGDKTPR
jgi:hypothetical protein